MIGVTAILLLHYRLFIETYFQTYVDLKIKKTLINWTIKKITKGIVSTKGAKDFFLTLKYDILICLSFIQVCKLHSVQGRGGVSKEKENAVVIPSFSRNY